MAQAAEELGSLFEDWNSITEKRRRDYETIFILSPAVNDERVKEMTSRFTTAINEAKGEILRQDDWGKVKMAYEIDKHAQGHYFYYRYIGNGTTVAALERLLKLDAEVLRFQTVRLSDPLSDEEVSRLKQKVPAEKISPPHAESEDETDFGQFRH